ncbi:uncharacterized protein BO80DRAFT_83106 [Aspergillus ibericus CBS 121593]|uniref:Uncharacterized protein n=1 Tax=Aspergillus ibericus CBS 121593 TaxID=1448316 RepID=A0A395HD15_9EURO|nr:hypothetical protein BO80DRAFT_83106 [Aspergillus ibericus CBS 121593]RAL05871.1 hypothetical protein BO80DRAFT_83106 [Aspergillus ibericus CBS 121593]
MQLRPKVRTPSWCARMILASSWMKIPVAYCRRCGGEGLGSVRLLTADDIRAGGPMLLGNLDETSSSRAGIQTLARISPSTRGSKRTRCLNHPTRIRLSMKEQ